MADDLDDRRARLLAKRLPGGCGGAERSRHRLAFITAGLREQLGQLCDRCCKLADRVGKLVRDGGIGFDRASYRAAEDTGVTGEPVDVWRRIDVAVSL